MKKILKTFFIFVLLSARLFASDCDLKNVPENFLGTYMPVHMELLMKQNHSYVKSLNAISVNFTKTACLRNAKFASKCLNVFIIIELLF